MADIVLNDNSGTYISGEHDILRCIQGSTTATASAATFSVTLPAFTTYISSNVWPVASGGTVYGGSYRAQVRTTYADCDQGNYGYSSNSTWIKYTDAGGTVNTLNKGDARVQRAVWSPARTISLNTSSYFTSSNSTSKTATIPVAYITPSQSTGWYNTSFWFPQNGSVARAELNYAIKQVSSNAVLAYATVTLNAPPTFTSTQVSFNTNYVYAGYTTASVTISNLSAKYGGGISSAVLKIGSQTASRTTNGTLSINLNAAGTFTPTVTVTDSRGQSTTTSLNPITVNAYVAPAVTLEAERTDATGKPNDEGAYCVVTANFNWTSDPTNLQAPVVTVKDYQGLSVTVTTAWYAARANDGTLSGAISDWASLTKSQMPVYALITGATDLQHTYKVSVTPRDTSTTGTATTQTLPSAYYTIDFLAGGHGIAFGQACTEEGFWCNMDAYLGIPDNQTAGSPDKALYDAIVALGWQNDVIV